MQHTPGPWILWGNAEPSQVISADGVFVAQTLGGNDEANARLISAAPDLLVALRKAFTALELVVYKAPELGVDDAYHAVSDAIAKATGLTEG